MNKLFLFVLIFSNVSLFHAQNSEDGLTVNTMINYPLNPNQSGIKDNGGGEYLEENK
jgi:hypothetical protein